MNEEEVIEIAREALVLLLKLGAPIMLTALAVGLLIALFQALTQIQEMTLSFVPKIIVVFGVLILFLPTMLDNLQAFMLKLADRIISLG